MNDTRHARTPGVTISALLTGVLLWRLIVLPKINPLLCAVCYINYMVLYIGWGGCGNQGSSERRKRCEEKCKKAVVVAC